MQSLELEAMLEDGLSKIGASLGRRIYCDEIQTGAEIDAIFAKGEVPVQDIKSPEDYYRVLDLATERGISMNQVADRYGWIPFIQRTSSEYNGVYVQYVAFQDERLTGKVSGNVSDTLFKMNLITEEGVNLYKAGEESSFGAIEIVPEGGKRVINVEIEPEVNDEFMLQLRLEKIKALHGKEYDAKEVYEAVMDFLKYE